MLVLVHVTVNDSSIALVCKDEYLNALNDLVPYLCFRSSVTRSWSKKVAEIISTAVIK